MTQQDGPPEEPPHATGPWPPADPAAPSEPADPADPAAPSAQAPATEPWPPAPPPAPVGQAPATQSWAPVPPAPAAAATVAPMIAWPAPPPVGPLASISSYDDGPPPFTIGALLRDAFARYGNDLVRLLAITFVAAVLNLASSYASMASNPLLGGLGASRGFVDVSGLLGLASFVVGIIASSMTFALLEGGPELPFGRILRRGVNRAGWMFLTSLLLGLGLVGILIVTLIPAALLSIANTGVALLVMLGVGLVVVWLALRVSLAVPANVADNLNSIDAIKLSWRLTRPSGVWLRLLGSGLLIGLLVLPASLGSVVLLFPAMLAQQPLPLVGAALISAFVTPLGSTLLFSAYRRLVPPIQPSWTGRTSATVPPPTPADAAAPIEAAAPLASAPPASMPGTDQPWPAAPLAEPFPTAAPAAAPAPAPTAGPELAADAAPAAPQPATPQPLVPWADPNAPVVPPVPPSPLAWQQPTPAQAAWAPPPPAGQPAAPGAQEPAYPGYAAYPGYPGYPTYPGWSAYPGAPMPAGPFVAPPLGGGARVVIGLLVAASIGGILAVPWVVGEFASGRLSFPSFPGIPGSGDPSDPFNPFDPDDPSFPGLPGFEDFVTPGTIAFGGTSDLALCTVEDQVTTIDTSQSVVYMASFEDRVTSTDLVVLRITLDGQEILAETQNPGTYDCLGTDVPETGLAPGTYVFEVAVNDVVEATGTLVVTP